MPAGKVSDPLPQTAGVHAGRGESLRWNASSRRELQRSVELLREVGAVLAEPVVAGDAIDAEQAGIRFPC